MEYAPGALGTLVQKLLQLLKDEYNLQKGAKKDIEYLRRELESMSVPLLIVREEPPGPHNWQMRIWANDVRELSYDMEDIVDSFLVHVQGPEPASKKSTKRFIKKMVQKVTEATARHDIAQEIKEIKERVKEVAERRDRYKVDYFSPHEDKDPRIATMCTRATNLVGIDEAREELIFKLTKADDMSAQKPRILSIVGFGGLGKSTLAREVYEKLKVHFDCTAFVSVSRNPDIKKVLKDILYELDRGMYRDIHSKMWDDRQLINEVQLFLANKRYFIVIDDIWELASWETIKSALDNNNCGSKVITTTRNVDVAIVTGETYKMLPLSYSNSKKLFFMRIFGDKRKCLDYQSDEISDKFLKKCDGIPLAIITAASLLVGKPREIWSELYRDIGFGHKDNMQVVENTRKILSYSYYDMPSHLKPCLLYLSAFPEDYVIRKDPLVWKWIAEGFVHPKEGMGLFEVGEQYFNDLANRNMIQMVESEIDGIIDGCRVHDMVLDLTHDLALNENFMTILHNGEGTFSQEKTKVKVKVHRLAFQKSTMENISPDLYHVDLQKVRSYIASMCISNQEGQFFSFGLLRVLAIEYCQFQEDCNNFDNLCNLVHLRYLSVRGTNMSKLPEQIGNLKFLETLDFKESSVEKLPSSIVRLTKLVCLCCGWDITEVPDGIIRSMTSLEQLSIIFDWKDDVNHIRRFVKELGSLTELRVLKFSFINNNIDEIERDLVESLRNLHKIQHLEISYFFDTTNADIAKWEAASIVLPGHLRHLFLSRIMFPRLPSCIDLSRLHHLSYLALYVVTLGDQDLKLLSRLTELRYLQLVGMEATVTVNEINTDGDCFFPNLSWFILEGAMVHFELNEDSSSFSFQIWNGVDPMPFGSRRFQGSSVPFTLMPNLECLTTSVFPLALKDGNSDCSNIGLEYLPSLRKVRVDILCQRESPADVEEAANMLKSTINAHPNRPTLQAQRWQYGTASSVQDQLEDVYNLPMEENEDDQEEVVTQAAEAGIFKLSFPSP